MADQTPHASVKDLTAFSLGQLLETEANVVERHVSDCDQCCQTLLDLSSTADTFVQLLQESKGELPPPDTMILNETLTKLSAEDAPKDLINHPRYEVVQLIGVGGMGSVYRARHRMMDRTVAIKVINHAMVRNLQVIERFHREVKSAAKLSHHNIVTAFDAEQVAETHFLVMEFVEGTDLADIVASRGPLDVAIACEYIRQAAIGLQHAHEQGMVHRDIKPHNLMLTTDGSIKILDFGLATLTHASISGEDTLTNRADLTAVGTVMGTPDYISPEQAIDARTADSRSDIYSLGSTLYFLLAGRPPFEKDSVSAILKDHAESNPDPINRLRAEVPAEVAALLTRMMSKNPSERFQTASEVASALAPFASKYAITDSGVAQLRASRTSKRSAWPKVAAAVVLLGFVLASAAYMITRPAPANRDDTAPNAMTSSSANTPATAIKTLNSLALTRIDAGEFVMGTPPVTKGIPVERPHRVMITNSFEIGTFEVTQQEYQWVMGTNPSSFSAANDSTISEDTGRYPG